MVYITLLPSLGVEGAQLLTDSRQKASLSREGPNDQGETWRAVCWPTTAPSSLHSYLHCENLNVFTALLPLDPNFESYFNLILKNIFFSLKFPTQKKGIAAAAERYSASGLILERGTNQ